MTAQIKVKVQRKAVVKLKVMPRFPANIVAANFLSVTRSNGTYTFGADYSLLTPGPVSDAATAMLAVQDQTAGIYRTVSLSSLLTSGLDADLQAIAALSGTGILVRSAANTWVQRSITAGTAMGVTNGDGVAGNITVSLTDAELVALSGLVSAADQLPYFTGSGTASLTTLTTFARTLLDDTTQGAMQTTLGLVPGTNVQAFDSDLAALATNSTNGLWARTGTGTGAARTLTGTASQITVTNGDGVSGNPTVALTNTAVTPGSYTNTNLTVDAQGRITAASTGAAGAGGSIFFAESYGAVGNNSTDNTTAVQNCINAAIAAGGGLILFGPGIFRVNSQLTIDGSGITVMGAGKGGLTSATGTVLDLRASAHKIVVGQATTQRSGIRFTNLHVYDGATTSFYVFETRNVRHVSWDNITFENIYGFVKLGRSGEQTNFAYFGDGFEGNMSATTYQHFIDAVNVAGPLMISGNSHIEGQNPVPSGSAFLNFGTSATRVDGMQMSGWCVRLFDYGINFARGCSNAYITNVIFDGTKSQGIYADTAVDNINGLMISNCHFAGVDLTAVSSGITVKQTVQTGARVVIANNNIFNMGDEGIFVQGTCDFNITGNTLINVGQRVNNNASGIAIANSAPSGVCANNVIVSNSANKVAYGVNNQSTSAFMLVHNNVANGAVTAPHLGNKIGQLIEATSATAAILSSTATNLTSISLPAGDWDVWGTIVTDPAGTTTTSFVNGSIGTTSATAGTHPNSGADVQFTGSVPAGNRIVMPTGTRRLSLTSTTTVYLVGFVIFAVSTMNAYGYIGARRVCQQ